MREYLQILDETVEDKEIAIKKATFSKSISLITREFGRGTDFICYDKTVNDKGGVVVIQTFLSLEYSEEVQIRGKLNF